MKIGSKLRKAEGGIVLFHCPGCDSLHQVRVEGSNPWSWNGSTDAPTFSPSVLVRTGHFADENRLECWCNYEQRYGKPAPFSCVTCHSFVKDGKIQFLSDCTHALAGQTIELPDVR